jgi:hypothetical protein
MKFTPAQIKFLKTSQTKVQKLVDKQDSIYEDVKTKLNVSDNGGYLLDYLFNDFGDIETLEENLEP